MMKIQSKKTKPKNQWQKNQQKIEDCKTKDEKQPKEIKRRSKTNDTFKKKSSNQKREIVRCKAKGKRQNRKYGKKF